MPARAEQRTRWLPALFGPLFVALFLAGVCSRGYGYYNQTWKAGPQVWTDVVHGTANAPEQYRIGVVMTAYWLSEHLHVRLSRVFGVLDLLSVEAAVGLLYGLLRRGRVFAQASRTAQWFGSAAFAALVLYVVDWTNWYQKVSTLPTALLVAAMLWLWTPPGEGAGQRGEGKSPSSVRPAATVAGLLALAVAQSFIRADVAAMVGAGVFVVSAVGRGRSLSLPRGAAMAVSAATAAVAVGVQLYLMKVRYPQAGYGGVPAFMLLHDWSHVFQWATVLIFTAPFLWTVREVLRTVRATLTENSAGVALLLAGCGYAVLWMAMGRLDEVRIFLPLALAVTPLTVEAAMRRAQERPHLGGDLGLKPKAT